MEHQFKFGIFRLWKIIICCKLQWKRIRLKRKKSWKRKVSRENSLWEFQLRGLLIQRWNVNYKQKWTFGKLKCCFVIQEKSQYNTLPHHKSEKNLSGRSCSMSHGQTCSKSNVQKRRRKSHGLTIKIESPTTGEDSSAGIIDSAILTSSPSNIYLSGTKVTMAAANRISLHNTLQTWIFLFNCQCNKIEADFASNEKLIVYQKCI